MNTKIKITFVSSGFILIACALMATKWRPIQDDATSPGVSISQNLNNKALKLIATESETKVTRNSPRDSKDLTADEIKSFVADVDKTFGTLVVAGVNEDEINKSLSRLNERREAGVRALIKILSVAPNQETEVRERISIVDYLIYRSRWDDETRAKILRLATSEIPSSVPDKLKGAMVVERSEIIGRLAAIDWDSTRQALQSLEHTATRQVAAAEAVMTLAEQGMPLEQARQKVKDVVPEYIMSPSKNVHSK